MDIISGSWPGEIFLFKGGPNRIFAAPEMIKDKDGNIINIGGGMREEKNYLPIIENQKQPETMILIAGNAKFERTEEGTFVNYQGKRYESTLEKPIAITGTASTAQPVDWDGDGDLDLLVGADDGSVSLFENIGDAKSPKLASAKQLVPPSETASPSQAPKEVRRGSRSKICVTDWNEDGRLDLLVGDLAYQKPDLPEPTPEEKAEHDRIHKELEQVQKKYSELSQKLYAQQQAKPKEQIEQAQKEMEELRGQMTDLRSKLPVEYERHGWVWLFLRKPEK